MDTRLKCLTGARQFFALFGQTSKAMMGLRKLPPDQRISKQLGEKISLAVSGVNNCRYCTWLHTKTALEKGLSKREIDALLAAEFDGVAPEEQTAILYAQHWADREGDVSAEARQRVLDEYGPHRTAEIEASIRAVYFGNLCSNTVVACREAKAEGREPPVSLFTYVMSFPVAGAIRRMSGVKNE
ncbi:MAG: carboxymuconolactone decarboxylase family protein [Spirochaetales bacterium]|nr:carboxymuconolactone decarboxylase family protein [Spirochaetales bacterium]